MTVITWCQSKQTPVPAVLTAITNPPEGNFLLEMSEFHSSSLPESSKHVVVADMMRLHTSPGEDLVSVIPPLAGAGRGGGGHGETWQLARSCLG